MTQAINKVSAGLTLRGGCLCGAIRYIAYAETNDAYRCHCRMCQRASGNLFATFFDVKKVSVTWDRGEPRYYSSSKIARRGFCSDCGTSLTFDYHGSENMDLSVGSLDHPELMKPVVHTDVESRVVSFHVDDGLPGKRVDEFEDVMQRWRSAYGADVVPGPQTMG